MSEIICPYCGTSNSPDADQCRSCHKFLFGEPPGGSSAQTGADDDWLNNLRGDTRPLPEDEPAPEEPTPSSDEEEIPDWLARIRQRTQEDIPPTPPGEDSESDEELPDWLKEIHLASQFQEGESQPAEQPLDDIPLPDWLAASETQPEAVEDTIPDMLHVTAEPEAESALEEGELPDWLSSLPLPAAEEQPGEVSKITAEDTPDWLKPFDSYAGESAALEELPAAPAGDEWLKSFESFGETAQDEEGNIPFPLPAEEDTSAPVDMPAAQELLDGEIEIPAETGEAWLASLATVDETNSEQADLEPSAVSGEEWLKSFDAHSEETLPPPETPVPSGEEWLKSFEPLPVAEQPPAAADAEELPPFEEVELPVESESPPFDLPYAEEFPLLEELESSPAFNLQPDQSAALDEETDSSPFISDELPDWFADDQLLDTLHKDEKLAVDGETSLEPAELPGWLQAMRPLEAVSPGRAGSDADQRVETSGPLSGYQGVLPGEALVTQYSKPGIYSGRLQVLEKQRAYASLLESLVAEEKRSKPAPAEKSSAPRLLGRILVSALIVVVVLAFLVGGFTAAGLPGLYAPESVAFFTRIQSLSAGTSPIAPLLLAVDFEPALAGEIRTAAQPVMDDLLANGIPVVILSTNPTGAVLAEDLLSPLSGFNPDSVQNMGYLPGGSSALAALASQPRLAAPTDREGGFAWDRPFLQGITHLSDFSAVLLLTDNTETSRAWVEQVAPVLADTPLLVIASNQAAPMIQPYIQSGQVTGMLAGLPGFAAYQQLSGRASPQSGYWDAYQAGLMLIVVLILLSSLFFIGRQLIKPKSEKRN